MKAIENIYSYYFPEVRRVIDEVTKDFPHDVFLKAISPGLDNFHVPVIEKYIKFVSRDLPGLENFEHMYVTAGSSEGIFHILVHLKMKDPKTRIYVFKGDYSGYKKYAEYLGMEVFEVENWKNLEKGVWFITNPSTINGNIVPNSLILDVCNAGHKVIVDCSYFGLTRPHHFEIRHPNIIAVLSSFSKSFGMFYYRIGFTFSREKIASLETNIWFKNILSLIILDRIFSEFDQDYFYRKYRLLQEKIINKMNKELSLNIKPSDVLLVGYMDRERDIESIEKFKREKYYRFCLTPYFMEEEIIRQ